MKREPYQPQGRSGFIGAILLVVMMSTLGCGTIERLGTRERPQIYGGVLRSYQAWPSLWEYGGPFALPFLLDFPLCAVADTGLLPFTVYREVSKASDRAKRRRESEARENQTVPIEPGLSVPR